MTSTPAVRGYMYLVKGFGVERYVHAPNALAAIRKLLQEITR